MAALVFRESGSLLLLLGGSVAMLQLTQPCPPVWDCVEHPSCSACRDTPEIPAPSQGLAAAGEAVPRRQSFANSLPGSFLWGRSGPSKPQHLSCASHLCSRKDPYPAPHGWTSLHQVGNFTGDKSKLEHPSQFPLWVSVRPGSAEPKCPSTFSSLHSTKMSPRLFLRENTPFMLELHIWVRRRNSKHMEFFWSRRALSGYG